MSKQKKAPSFAVHGGATKQEESDSIIRCKCPACGEECFFGEEFVSFLAIFDSLLDVAVMLPIHAPCKAPMNVVAYKDPEKGYWMYDKDIDSFLDRVEKKWEEM